ncbi:MAG: PstS family phosphate ABC transporter substrate-binding protein [Chloroflexi bacterium]|nr:PstS family phosphate ABC transporter substrate-binding protein [Chloroflexota bacterium]
MVKPRAWVAVGLAPDPCPLTSEKGCVAKPRAWAVVGLLGLLTLLISGCNSAPAVNAQGQPVVAARTIQNTGSDTLVNLALAWAERYMPAHPGVRISVTGGGSGTGIAALINGTTDIANASRGMKKEELDAAQKNGIAPVEFTVARDAIAIVVNPANPVNGLTLQQLSDIYQGKITNWRQVGGVDRPIVLLSRESNSGTYVYFLENVLRLGKKSDLLFSPDTLLMPSSEGISVEVRQNPNALGYDGLGYVTADQKVVAVAKDAGSSYVKPSVATVNDGSYPISRPLFMYTAGQPTGQVKDYLDWIVHDGQALVVELGFVPLK